MNDHRDFFQPMLGDGRPPLLLLALGLTISGLFAVFLAASGQFLPHDERFLGQTAEGLCSLHGCRIVHFMIHDRLAFGGALVAIGMSYFWLVEFPLREGHAWAWWLLLFSGTIGFASFLAYLAFGYLDIWHAVATLILLPCFLVGLLRSRSRLVRWESIRCLLRPVIGIPWSSGRLCLLATAVGMVGGGVTILFVGMTCVFVPQDLGYLGLGVAEMDALNPRLVPLIAHDRAGFGGAILCCGVVLFFIVWCGHPSRSLWQMLALAGLVGFAAAIGAHPAVGYNDPVHLAPAVLGAMLYLVGLVLTYRPMMRGTPRSGDDVSLPPPHGDHMPSLAELGADLTRVTAFQRCFSLALPFALCGSYFSFAALGWWPAAVACLVALSFVTYGSVSHDLVHRTLGLPRWLNDLFLCLIELLALRSGHAYRAAHLHHHARYPHPDDVEALVAGRSWLRAVAEGPVFQVRIWLWAVRNARHGRPWIIGEGLSCLVLYVLSPLTPSLIVYAVLMTVGGWVIPLVTAYLPHDPKGKAELFQTRAFSGMMASVLALEHLYHLEHHLYPAVPHHNWPKLARRLDPYLKKAGVKSIRFWF
jgi:fatty acid desaturase